MKRAALALLFLAAALPAAAWTRNADRDIAVKSAALAPPDLRLLIEKYNDDYLRGVERALASEATDPHREQLRARIDAQANAIVKMIRGNAPMSSVVEQLGILAHLVSDANNPFHVAANETSAHDDFERFFERRLPKFAPVFYGFARNVTMTAYLDKVFSRTAQFGPLMAEEYTRGNGATFDDRSTAFGVASVCYSHAITDIANIDYFIWKSAGGAATPPRIAHAN